MEMATNHAFSHFFESSPVSGAIITGTSLVASHLIPFIDGGHINPLVLEFMQLGGYATTMIVGTYTIIGYIRKWKKEK
jgi:hypothetical protein